MWSVLKIKYGYPSFKIPKKHGSVFECADEKIQFWNVQEETSQNTKLLQTERHAVRSF